jgi:kynurenine formamidase
MAAEPDIDLLLETHNNWNRWGAADIRGTLNLLTPQVVSDASRLVRTGTTVGMGRVVGGSGPQYRGTSPIHFMTEVPNDALPGHRGTSSDWIGLAPHGFAVTHIDALCHQSWRGRFYNNAPADAVSTRAGARALNLTPLADGVFAPAVLLDLPAAQGRRWLEPGEEVGPAALEHAARELGARPKPGEIMIVRTGRDAAEREIGFHDPIVDGNPGLGAAVAGWLDEINPAVLVTDVQCDVMRPGGAPHPMPLHVVCLVGLGVHLVDNARLDGIADECLRQRRWRFAVAMSPLNVKHATGSPVNPIAIL